MTDVNPLLLAVVVIIVRLYQVRATPADEALPLAALVAGVALLYGWEYLPERDQGIVEQGIWLGLAAVGGHAGFKTLVKSRDGSA